MNDDFSDDEKLEYIHHWESQAGRILRLSITVTGLVISASSVLITLIATSNQIVIPDDPIRNNFSLLISQLAGLPIIGEPTALVLALVLTTFAATLSAIALILIFVFAPIQSLQVMDTPEIAESSKDAALDTLYAERGVDWHQTVEFFKYGMISLVLSLVFVLPIFVIRNARFSATVLLLLFVIGLVILKQYHSAIVYFVWNSSPLDILNVVGGVLFFSLLLSRPPNPGIIWDIITVSPLVLPTITGIRRGYLLEFEGAGRYFWRDMSMVGVFGLGAIPALLIVSDVINGEVGTILFILMTVVGTVASVSTVGIISGWLVILSREAVAVTKSRLTHFWQR